jgi:hypothetical protein
LHSFFTAFGSLALHLALQPAFAPQPSAANALDEKSIPVKPTNNTSVNAIIANFLNILILRKGFFSIFNYNKIK